jgi:RND family efflux transporter MFP subunit
MFHFSIQKTLMCCKIRFCTATIKKINIQLITLLLLSACQATPPPPSKSREREETYLVEVTTVTKQSLNKIESYTGDVVARRSVRIFTQEAGKIMALPYYEGDTIKIGSTLVQLDDALLKAQFNKMQATYQQTQVNTKRLRLLGAKKLVSDEDVLKAETEEAVARADVEILTRLSYTTIAAPFTGILTERLVEIGDIVTANTHVATLIDPNSLIIRVSLPEVPFNQLKLQDNATIAIDALGSQTWQGKVSRLHPTLDATTRLGIVEISLNPLPSAAKSGQFAKISFDTLLKPHIAIPYNGLRRDREGEFVFLITETNQAQRQTVRSGQRLANVVEITQGLTEGQKIVTRGFLGLQAGKTVQIAKP